MVLRPLRHSEARRVSPNPQPHRRTRPSKVRIAVSGIRAAAVKALERWRASRERMGSSGKRRRSPIVSVPVQKLLGRGRSERPLVGPVQRRIVAHEPSCRSAADQLLQSGRSMLGTCGLGGSQLGDDLAVRGDQEPLSSANTPDVLAEMVLELPNRNDLHGHSVAPCGHRGKTHVGELFTAPLPSSLRLSSMARPGRRGAWRGTLRPGRRSRGCSRAARSRVLRRDRRCRRPRASRRARP